ASLYKDLNPSGTPVLCLDQHQLRVVSSRLLPCFLPRQPASSTRPRVSFRWRHLILARILPAFLLSPLKEPIGTFEELNPEVPLGDLFESSKPSLAAFEAEFRAHSSPSLPPTPENPAFLLSRGDRSTRRTEGQDTPICSCTP